MTLRGPEHAGPAEDQLAIRDLLARYCRAVDRVNGDALTAVFQPGATVDKGSGPMEREAYVADVVGRHRQVEASSHQVSNILIDFLGGGEAFVESWGHAVERRRDAAGRATDFVFRVSYGDRVDRRDGVWRVASRILVIDHVLAVAVPPEVDGHTRGRFVGLRSPADPIEALRVSLVAA